MCMAPTYIWTEHSNKYRIIDKLEFSWAWDSGRDEDWPQGEYKQIQIQIQKGALMDTPTSETKKLTTQL